MKLTKRGEYALRTLIRLGVAAWNNEGVISVSVLAEKERLPFKFLEAILFDLRNAGYVESVRGKYGGARLAKPLNAVKMGEVVRLIDGKLAPIGCASETEYEKCSCPDEEHCGLRMLMIDVRNAVANILDKYTLEDVVEVTLRKQLITASTAKKSTRKAGHERHADPADGFLAVLLNTAPARRR
ncbi:MAG TPA: Rrf2 family transcriptional regulator [Verrucomicrobiales bacterium]|nr:Rrf2 family transcriptional regulator [Verrucomicrobiales bacterium]HRJ08457.1 Rrf2 family transcriptional regulator [Prosthecobacter sp.]HRK15146.1 Rrf2 family transcriptional regulator [Prosthecobacter sp.]